MPVALGVLAVVSIATTVASTIETKKADDAAANTAKTIGQYNADIDMEEAKQVDYDSTAAIDQMRANAATYMSRTASAYARNGIIANRGSPLAVQAMEAGRAAMKEQQTYSDAQAKEQYLASSAQAGVLEADSQADQDHMEGVAAVMGGVGKVAGQIGAAYGAGVFGSPGSSTSTALSNPGAGPGGSESLSDPGE